MLYGIIPSFEAVAHKYRRSGSQTGGTSTKATEDDLLAIAREAGLTDADAAELAALAAGHGIDLGKFKAKLTAVHGSYSALMIAIARESGIAGADRLATVAILDRIDPDRFAAQLAGTSTSHSTSPASPRLAAAQPSGRFFETKEQRRLREASWDPNGDQRV